MNALDYLYFIIYYGNRLKPDDKRFNPAAMIVLTVSPVVHALFGLVAGPVGSRPPVVPGSHVLYARYDLFTYTSIIVSALIAWRLFDKRRVAIIQTFQNFIPSRIQYWGTVAASLCFIVVCTYLSTRDSIYAVLFASAALLAGSIVAKRISSHCVAS